MSICSCNSLELQKQTFAFNFFDTHLLECKESGPQKYVKEELRQHNPPGPLLH